MIRICTSADLRRMAQLLTLSLTALFAVACSSGQTADTATLGGSTQYLAVSDSSTFVIVGPEGGPFPNGSRDYELTNNGPNAIRWEGVSSEPWIQFSSNGGALPPGRSSTITVSLDGNYAATLPYGQYDARVLFRGADFPTEEVHLRFLLFIRPQGGGGELTVTPQGGFNPVGDVGGPVTPDRKVYTLQNTGTDPVDWTASTSQNWLTIQGPTSGTLDPGALVSLTARIDSNAMSNLTAGTHTGLLHFTNTSNDVGSTERRVVMTLNSVATGNRVTDGLMALYNFSEGGGNVVRDSTGLMDLSIANPQNVSWSPGALTINSPTTLASGPVTALNQSIRSSNELSFEVWIEPANLTQEGPARILSISNGLSSRNFTLGQGLWNGQPSSVIDARLRTTATNTDGIPSITTGSGTLGAGLSHVMYTRDAQGTARIYINGVETAMDFRGGDLSNWDTGYSMLLGNEATGDRPWLGTFHLASAYDRALSASEVQQNFAAGPGDIMAGQLSVTPGNGFNIQGREGGPFNPDRKTYTLTNTGSVPIQWSSQTSESWLSINGSSSGTLNPAASVDVEVRLDNSQASNLSAGPYFGVVSFNNDTDGFGSTDRDVVLNVQSQSTGGGVTIVPGSGFNGSTPEPGQIGSGLGADAKSIARWDVVPYQDFSTDFNVGVVAFHMNGIDRVEFSCEGGPWVAVSEMTLNDRTDAVEYWGTLPADGFSQDGLIEVRAIAYPTVGRPRLLESLYLNVTTRGTMPDEIRWVSPSGSDSANGSQSAPFRTIWKAASAIHDAQGGNAGGGTIYLLPGSYDLPDRGSAPPHAMPVTTTRWLTVAGAPGTSRNQVVISDSDTTLSKRVHLKDLLIRTVLSASATHLPDVWVDNVEMTQQGSEYGQSGGNNFYPPMLRGNELYWFSNIYQTDVYVHHTRMNNTRTTLERNVLVEDIISQGFYNPIGLVLNSRVNGINASGTLDHPDMIHLQGPNAINVIMYNLEFLNCGAQGIFARNNPGYESHYRDVALVNIVIDNHPHYWQNDWSVSTDHLLWWNISTPYQKAFVKSYEYPATMRNFSVRDCVFDLFQSPTPTVQDNNHYFDAAQSNPLGTNATTGGSVTAMFLDPDASLPDFTPLSSSPLVERTVAPVVPVDLRNRPRTIPASIGALEAD